MDPIDGPPVESCIAATVDVGGPRTAVRVRYAMSGEAVTVERVRVVAQAPRPPDPTQADGC